MNFWADPGSSRFCTPCPPDSLAPPTESRPQEADVTSYSRAFCVIDITDWLMEAVGEEGQPWDKGEEKVASGLGGTLVTDRKMTAPPV